MSAFIPRCKQYLYFYTVFWIVYENRSIELDIGRSASIQISESCGQIVSDVVDKQTRSRMMSGIKGKDTAPEILIRRELHRRGFRYKLHAPEIPGKPDLVFSKYQAVVEVNGCFWHGHMCDIFKWPKIRPEFWKEKIEGNMKRDRRNILDRQVLGWRTLTVWECETRKKERTDSIVNEIVEWLESGEGDHSIPDV